MIKKTKSISIISCIILFFVLALYIYPISYLFNVSLKSNMEFMLSPNSFVKEKIFSNFAEAWKVGSFSRNMWNSIIYTSCATLLSMVLSLLAAFPIARNYIKGSSKIYIFFLISMFLPNILIPQFQLMRFLNLDNTRIGYILLKTGGTGLAFFIFTGYIKSISKDLDCAAAIDGCGYTRFLFTIIAPLMGPVIATGIILTSIGVWNDIIYPVIFLSNPKLAPVTLGLFNFYGQYQNNWPLLACGILIVILPLVLLYVFLQKYIIEGQLSGSIKG